ncbi:MAG: serine hydrolase [Desulfovibrio sp.]|nr:serine hydrolase [Desulfovibrio sp.]MBI4960592.1 serine hydrolase [Desulfovibrio sp.]
MTREYVFGPLGMASSMFAQPLPPEYQARAAKGHDCKGRELPGGFRVYPELAAAGLWTTATDLARLVIALNRIVLASSEGGDAGKMAPAQSGVSAVRADSGAPFLPRELGRRMVQDAALAECMKSGLGIFTMEAAGESYLLHWGANAGYRALFICRPSKGQGVAVLAAGDNGEALIAEVVRSVAALQCWPGFEPASFTPRRLSKNALVNLCGKYAGNNATVEVTACDGMAQVKTRPDVAPLPMYTENGVEFWFADQLGAARVIFDGDELVLANCPSRAERFRRIR